MKFSFSACDLGQVTRLGMESVERERDKEELSPGKGLWHGGWLMEHDGRAQTVCSETSRVLKGS